MSEEKKLILKMLKEGKISEDEAIQLLDSIKDSRVENDRYSQFEANFINKIVSAVDKIGKKSQEVINNFDIEDLTMGFGSNSNLKAKAEKINNENIIGVENPKVFITNLNGKVSITSWDNDEIEVRSKINYDDKLISTNHEFIAFERNEDNIVIQSNIKDSNQRNLEINMSVMLPKKIYEEIKVETTNAKIEIEDVETKKLDVSSANAKINLNRIVAENAVLKTTNARIQVQNITGESLEIDTSNGKIELAEIASKIVDLATTNGGLVLSKLSSAVESIKASTYNGNISVSLDGIFKPVMVKVGNANSASNSVNLTSKTFTNFVNADGEQIAYSDDFDEDVDNLIIEAATFNGAININ